MSAFAYVVEKMLTIMEINLSRGIQETRLSYGEWGVIANERLHGKKGGRGKTQAMDFLKKPFTVHADIYGNRDGANRGDGFRVTVEIVTPAKKRGSGAGMVVLFSEWGEERVLVPRRGAVDAAREEYEDAHIRVTHRAEIDAKVDEVREQIDAFEGTVAEKQEMRRHLADVKRRLREHMDESPLQEEARFREEMRMFGTHYWKGRLKPQKTWINPNLTKELLRHIKKKP